MAGGDLRAALDKDARRELVWGRKGQQVALDIARGIHFLHSHDVRVPCDPRHPPADAAHMDHARSDM